MVQQNTHENKSAGSKCKLATEECTIVGSRKTPDGTSIDCGQRRKLNSTACMANSDTHRSLGMLSKVCQYVTCAQTIELA